MLSDFTEKKETFLTLKNREIAFLQKVNSMLLIKKCQIFLFKFDQNKPGNNAF